MLDTVCFTVQNSLLLQPPKLTILSFCTTDVPAVSYNIHLFNKQASKEDQISLRGLAIGNGLTGEQPAETSSPQLVYLPTSTAPVLNQAMCCWLDDTCGCRPGHPVWGVLRLCAQEWCHRPATA